ncbi:uncharacterized protein LOC5505112 [Nematostella vectensis]|uniref:uncharacterized protein LOC5505112 n=1 Tax=Nematostella vectensis TaxID=45351 RepID=UPI002077455A|nr:uncharacterized protein LOC5505112 [Nematostella vectensis]
MLASSSSSLSPSSSSHMTSSPSISSDEFIFNVEQSWGVASLRQCAGFPGHNLNKDQKNSYIAPLGPLIVEWDIQSKSRITSFQAHNDLVICLLYNEPKDVVLSISYGGEIKLWDNKWNNVLSTNTTFGLTHFGAWSNSGERFLICGGHTSLVAMYELREKQGKLDVALLWIQKSGEEGVMRNTPFGEVNATDTRPKESGNDSVTFVKQHDWYDLALFNSQDYIIAILQRVNNTLSEVHLLNPSGQVIKSQPLDPIGDTKASVMCMTHCKRGVFAVGFQGGIFLILDEKELEVKSVLQAMGSPQVALWDGDYLLAVSYLSGIMSWWSINGELVHELHGAPCDSIVHLNWAVKNEQRKAIWLGGIMSLSYITLEYAKDSKFPIKITEAHRLKYHEVTGCGLDMSDSSLIASGDLTGNIFIWKIGNSQQLYKLKHDAAVRCLAWRGQELLIGCLDGLILKWNNENIPANEIPGTGVIPRSELNVCLVCTSGVLTMRWSRNYLVIGLDSGELLVYRFQTDKLDSFEEVLKFCAHSLEEGQRQAEIWSVCWSPCGGMVASASEDQTTCIWSVLTGEKLHTLRGHTTAVTSVDWKQMCDGPTILATCADDRTVRVIDSDTFTLLHALKLKDVPGWYTLTYLSLYPIGQQIVCSTQNGRLALWDCSNGKLLECRKVHCGSIEGLVYSKDYKLCVTVGSDCVVNLFSIHL